MWACIICHRRKVKCDRQQPCSNCSTAGSICEYQPPPKPRRKRKASDGDLVAKIQKYELHLKKIGVKVDSSGEIVSAGPGKASSEGPDTRIAGTFGARGPRTQSQEEQSPATASGVGSLKDEDGTLLVDAGRSRYLENNLWMSINDQLQNSHHVLQDQECSQNSTGDNSGSSLSESNPAEMLLFGGSTVGNPIEHYPPSPVVNILWRVFLTNVQPLTKMIHAPTMEKLIQLSCQNVRTISRSNLALLFSMHLIAVASIPDEECRATIGTSQPELFKKYLSATHQALVRVSLLRTSDFTVVTAFSLYLLAIRGSFDAQTHWALCGLAMRIAQRIGLHRDAGLGLKPFEVEMRRRVWKQVLILDWAASEVAGSTPSHNFFATWWSSPSPTNLNDSDFGPNNTELPGAREGATEMIFCLLRYEFGAFYRHLRTPDSAFDPNWQKLHPTKTTITPKDDLADRDKLLDAFERSLEQKFLCYCDPIIPLHYLTTIVCRSVICGMRLRIHHPRQYSDGGASLSADEKANLFQLSLKSLQYDNLAFSTPALRPFMWHIRSFFQFHALIYLLSEIRTRRIGEEADLVWQEMELTYRHRPELSDRKHVLHTAIGLLAIRAWDAREVELRKVDLPLQTPDFIVKLRGPDAPQRSGPSSLPPRLDRHPNSSNLSGAWTHGLVTMDTAPPTDPNTSIDWAQWDNLLLNPDKPLHMDFHFNDRDPLFTMSMQN